MSKFLNYASITKKITLALLGVFLMVFLLIHLGINLCMLRDDQGHWFRSAAHFMGTNYIVKVFEIVLFAAIILHILLGIFLAIQNRLARPVGYKVSNKSKTSLMSKNMIWTGLLVLVFLGIHMVNFYFAKLGWVEGKYVMDIEEVYENLTKDEARYEVIANPKFIEWTNPQILMHNHGRIDNLTKQEIIDVFGSSYSAYEPDFYNMARELFSHPFPVIVYLILLAALGLHLNHAFQSAFQTLGLNHSKYTPAVKIIGSLYALLIAVGFMIIPIYIFLAV